MNLQEVKNGILGFSFEDLNSLHKTITAELRSKKRERAMSESKNFAVGDPVSFERRGLTKIGQITRCNPKTATIMAHGLEWTIPWPKLKKVQ